MRRLKREEVKEMEKRAKKINDIRGEIVNSLIEVEALVDEFIVKSYIRPEYQEMFYDILGLEFFSMSAKIRMFKEVALFRLDKKSEKFTIFNKLIKDIEKLNQDRNNLAHGLSIVGLGKEETFVVGRKSKKIDEDFLQDFQRKYTDVMASIHAIFISSYLSPADLEISEVKD